MSILLIVLGTVAYLLTLVAAFVVGYWSGYAEGQHEEREENEAVLWRQEPW